MKFATLIWLLLGPAATHALEVRFQPAETLYVYENAGEGTPRDLYTAVIQNIGIVNTGEMTVTLERVTLEASREGEVVQSQHLGADVLGAAAATFHAYSQAGVLEAYDFQFQTSRYLEGATFSEDLELAPGEAIVLQRRALLFSGLPDTVDVVVEASRGGSPLSARGTLRVVDHRSPNAYGFPVRGRWVAGAAPSLHSHHRWASLQEFALDLVQAGEGGLTHRGDGSRLEHYFAWGEPVHAIGDGVVVAARGSMPESDGNLRQPGESEEAYFERTMADQQKLLAGGFENVLGNHVVIEHPHGEYSMYLHLQTDSVPVAVGDRVTRGQQIGRLGHSGNSTEPHLHFHVTDGPSLSHSRALPVEFDDIALWPASDGTIRHLHSGQVVITDD